MNLNENNGVQIEDFDEIEDKILIEILSKNSRVKERT